MTTTPTTRTLIVLQMPFVDAQGDSHPASVWMPSAQTQDIVDEAGGIPWLGFSSAATLAAHDQPCGQHLTSVSKAAFVAGSQETIAQVAAAAGMPGLTADNMTEAENTAFLCIGLALATLDTPTNPPTTNPDGSPIMVSFFAGATVTTVTVTA